MTTPASPIVRIADDGDSALARLRDARRRDPLGHRIQIALAMLYLFLLPLATAPSGWAFALLVVNSVIRLPHTWRCYAALGRAPSLRLAAAWLAWALCSVAWSNAPAQGLDELSGMRTLLTPLLLWPVIDQVAWFVGAALAGVLAQNMVQIGQGFDLAFLPPREAGRLRGLLHPGHTGAWACFAITAHLVAVIRGRALIRAMSVVGLLAAGFGLVASGARGPWIALVVSVPVAFVLIAARRPDRRRAAVVVAAATAVVVVAVAPLAGPRLMPRVDRAVEEWHDAGPGGRYWTSIGLRRAMWRWSAEIWRSAPVFGVGAGGYRDAVVQLDDYREVAERKPRRAEGMVRDHCHTVTMQTLLTTGLIGAGLLAGFLVTLARQAWRDPPDHVYADAWVPILVGWFIGAQFDCYTLNSHTMGLLALVLAATMPGRPGPCETGGGCPTEHAEGRCTLPGPPVGPSS